MQEQHALTYGLRRSARLEARAAVSDQPTPHSAFSTPAPAADRGPTVIRLGNFYMSYRGTWTELCKAVRFPLARKGGLLAPLYLAADVFFIVGSIWECLCGLVVGPLIEGVGTVSLYYCVLIVEVLGKLSPVVSFTIAAAVVVVYALSLATSAA